MERKPLSGKVALVTGGGSGIGKAIALKFAENGAAIALDGRTRSKLISVQEMIEEGGGTANVFPIDISSEPECVRLVQSVINRFGRLDILVNNATYTDRDEDEVNEPQPLWKTRTDRFDNSFKVNVLASFVLSREAIPHMKKQKIGYIINIGTTKSRNLTTGGFQYSATKNAMRGMSITLSKEIRKEADIRVSVLHPGGTGSEWFISILKERTDRPDLIGARIIAPEEIAEAALFLATRTGNGVVDEFAVRRQDADYWCFI